MVEAMDMAWELKCREEDMRQRHIDNIRREIDDARRGVDEKAQQLKAISHLSALIAGFAMIVMVEIQLPDDIHLVLLVSFGATSALVVGLMLISMLNCTMMLIAILKYDCVQRKPPFGEFWRNRCEDDWQFAYRSFTTGVPMFLCVLAQVGWVLFGKYGPYKYYLGASVVTVIAVITGTLWFSHTYSKWGGFLNSLDLQKSPRPSPTPLALSPRLPSHEPLTETGR